MFGVIYCIHYDASKSSSTDKAISITLSKFLEVSMNSKSKISKSENTYQ
jgi:hypothetical protein